MSNVPPMPLKSRRAWNVVDLERHPPEEVATLRLRRHQVYPRGDPALVDPVVHPRPGLITKSTPVGTIGSCFAVRLQDWLTDYGYTVVRTERDPADAGSFACQTARFGIVYNTGCHRQVFESALGRFRPAERWWRHPDGRLLDPYRQDVAWSDEEDAERDLRRHAAAVREAVERSDVFIVTPGVAEVWRSRLDGATFFGTPPRGVFDPKQHEFGLSSVAENLENLERMYDAMRTINPALQVVITLSPAPLLATFRDVHVTEADAVSKATLRLAIDEFCRRHPEVIYFPSFEIVRRLTRDAYEIDNVHIRFDVVERIMVSFMTAYGDLDAPGEAKAPGAEDDPRTAPDPAVLFRRRYLREAWRRLALETRPGAVALFGAGRHTRFLLRAVADLAEHPRLACILDDHASPGATIDDVAVRRPEDVDPTTVVAVLVSSDAQEETLAERARNWASSAPAAARPVVERLYEGLPDGPYPTDE